MEKTTLKRALIILAVVIVIIFLLFHEFNGVRHGHLFYDPGH